MVHFSEAEMDNFAWLVGGLAVLIVLYLWRVESVLHSTPEEAAALMGEELTMSKVTEAYARIKKNRLDWNSKLPKAHDRRYVVVGGSGTTVTILDRKT